MPSVERLVCCERQIGQTEGGPEHGTDDASPHQRTGGNVTAGQFSVGLAAAIGSPGAAKRGSTTASLYFVVDVGGPQSDGDL